MLGIGTVRYALLTLLGLSIRRDSSPPELAAGSCTGLQVTDGSVSCSNSRGRTICHVRCGGEDHGKFICTERNGWSPKLPTCARPIGDQFGIIPSDVGCPDDTKCSIACQDHPHFRSKGSCVGPDKTICSCEEPLQHIEETVDAEATECNERQCMAKCSMFPIPMMGRCFNGACRCGYF